MLTTCSLRLNRDLLDPCSVVTRRFILGLCGDNGNSARTRDIGVVYTSDETRGVLRSAFLDFTIPELKHRLQDYTSRSTPRAILI